jgi:hypothetical protein
VSGPKLALNLRLLFTVSLVYRSHWLVKVSDVHRISIPMTAWTRTRLFLDASIITGQPWDVTPP